MRARRDLLVVGALALAVFVQAVPSLARKSLTFDEVTYIPSGYSYVATGDYRLNPEHPPLAKLLGGMALLPLRPAMDTTDASWRSADQWTFGREFFGRAGADTPRLVTVARLPIVALTALLVVFAFLFARELYGREAGLLAAWLCAFSPNLLAHGRLVTTDLAHAAFVLFTSYAFWRLARAPSARTAMVTGCTLGLALTTKYSAVLLPGLAVVWVAAGVWREVGGDGAGGDRVGDEGPEARTVAGDPDRWRRPVFALLGSFLVAAFVVTLAYQAPGRIDIYIRNLGVLYTNVHTELPAWLGGRFHEGRLWYYFVAAFLLKTPTAFLALLALRAADQLSRRDTDVDGALHLLLPAAVWFVLMSATALPFGVRYVLPAYPLLFVWVSGIAASPWVRGGRVEGGATDGDPEVRAPAVSSGTRAPAGTAVVAGLAILFAAGSLRAWPHYIPYFNVIAGGPDRGIEWLDDSNVDWGQDLPLLRDWLVERGIDDAVLAPMGQYDPALYGVPGRWATPQEVLGILTRPDPPPGVYAVSAHLLTRARWAGRPAVDPLTDLEPAAVLGHSIHVFVIGGR